MADPRAGRYMKLRTARMEKTREAMKEYDETVYYPALDALRTECAGIGHYPDGRWNLMVSGRAYQHCGYCGTTLYEDEEVGHHDISHRG